LYVEPPSKPSVTLLGPPVESGDVAAIARCTSTGFWPADINITWTAQEGPVEQALNQKVTNTGNNTFMVTSDYRRAVNRSINGKTLTCTVSHVSLSSPTSGSVTLTILCEYNSDLTVHRLSYFYYIILSGILSWNHARYTVDIP